MPFSSRFISESEIVIIESSRSIATLNKYGKAQVPPLGSLSSIRNVHWLGRHVMSEQLLHLTGLELFNA